MCSSDHALELKEFRIIAAKALRSVEIGEEFYSEYAID